MLWKCEKCVPASFLMALFTPFKNKIYKINGSVSKLSLTLWTNIQQSEYFELKATCGFFILKKKKKNDSNFVIACSSVTNFMKFQAIKCRWKNITWRKVAFIGRRIQFRYRREYHFNEFVILIWNHSILFGTGKYLSKNNGKGTEKKRFTYIWIRLKWEKTLFCLKDISN